MAIHLDDKTKLTTDVERVLARIGVPIPMATLTTRQLSEALVNAIELIGDHNPDLLRTLYEKVIGGESVE